MCIRDRANSCPGVCLHQPGAVKSKGGELMKAYELLFIIAPSTDEETLSLIHI